MFRRNEDGGLTFFCRLDKVVPILDLRRIDTGLRAKFLVIPEDHRSDVVWQSVGFALIHEILDAGRVKRIFKSSLLNCLGDILANARGNLLFHDPAAPAMENTWSIFRLEKRG